MYFVNNPVLWRNILKDAALAGLLTALTVFLLQRLQIQPKQCAKRMRRPMLIILAAALLPIGWRLAILPWRLPPQPEVHDEFSHLLVADTLAAGRFANPTHPLWRHFDTFYVLQHPVYASVYPIGQGVILCIGKLLTGNPWYGIVIATALMCGAIAWALLPLLPPAWVAVGVIPIAFTYGSQWMAGYWGGSFCAFGGALLCGAVLRLRKSPSISMAITAALGWSIVWLTRPFESLLLFAILSGAVAFFISRSRFDRRKWIAPSAAFLLTLSGAGAVTLMHNHAVTGSYTTVPYRLDQKYDGVPQSFLWQRPIPPPKFRFPEMKDMYLWQLHQKELGIFTRMNSTLKSVWSFFITPWFSLPLAFSLFAFRDRSVRMAWALIVCAVSFAMLYAFFFPHYIAAYCCVFAFLIIKGLMRMDTLWLGGRRVGRWLAAFTVFGGLFSQPMLKTSLKQIIAGPAHPAVNSREYISDYLKHLGGQYVIFVRYSPKHNFHNEWVYNAAEIDRSPIIWCRWMGPREDSEVMRYYPGRKFWILDVGNIAQGVRIADNLSPYPATHSLRTDPRLLSHKNQSRLRVLPMR